MSSHAQSMALLHPATSSNYSVGSTMEEEGGEPMSRTFQYRKVMKPLLERKRRARINKCLDELKDLMMHALQTEGENISKLEKADVLELTVRHLRKLKAANSLGVSPVVPYAQRFRGGYSSCAAEVSRFLASPGSGMDQSVSQSLLSRLAASVRTLDTLPPSVIAMTAERYPPPAPQPPAPALQERYSSSDDSCSPTSPTGVKRTYQATRTAYPPVMTTPGPPPAKLARLAEEVSSSSTTPLDYTRASLSKQEEDEGDSSDSSWRPW